MQSPLILSSIVLVLSLQAGHAMGLGFGQVTDTTALGRPLSFWANLRPDAGDSMEPGCIAADVMVGDRLLPAQQVRARLVRLDAGERRIRVTTTVSVDEPMLSVTVRAGCSSQLSRSFVIFADPPETLARTSDTDTDTDAGTHTSTTTTATATAVGKDKDTVPQPMSPPVTAASDTFAGAASRPTLSPGRAASTERRQGAVSVAPTAMPPRKPRSASPYGARASGPMLQLDPLDEAQSAHPLLRMTASLGSLPASGVADVMPDPEVSQRTMDQERLRLLEASVQQLRENERAKEQVLRALQAQVQSDRARDANPVNHFLVGLCALLAAGMAGVLWLRRHDRQQAAWWAAAVARERNAAAAEPATIEKPRKTPSTTAIAAPPAHAHAASPTWRAFGPPPSVDARAVPPAPSAAVGAAEPRRPMSAEELLDLEQQVEFFVVLGQDDAAIDLLMGHVRSTSGVSPLPYLKLLEIYRRREDREPFERIRERFNRRFNAYAPEWDVDPERGRDLAGYPEVLERMQGIWQMPSMAMELLDTLLFRRDAGLTFDVPAYRELLFLYGIASDLAERDVPLGGVDLLLPLGEDEPAPSISEVVIHSDGDNDEDGLRLDLDVSTGEPPNLAVEIPRRSLDESGTVLDLHVDDRDVVPRR